MVDVSTTRSLHSATLPVEGHVAAKERIPSDREMPLTSAISPSLGSRAATDRPAGDSVTVYSTSAVYSSGPTQTPTNAFIGQPNVRAHARARMMIDRGATLLARRGGARG